MKNGGNKMELREIDKNMFLVFKVVEYLVGIRFIILVMTEKLPPSIHRDQSNRIVECHGDSHHAVA